MKPNILFLVVDSLRADKFYGNAKTSITPNFNSLIKKGVYFSQTISSVASTSPSMGSIFTGLFPFKIGMGPESYKKINSEISTYVDHLKQNGYTTFATTSEINSFLGLTADFDLTIEQTIHNNYYSLFAGLGEKIINKLDSMPENPWFFYIHINDLHQPILVPKSFNDEKFGETDYEKMLSAIDFWIGKFLKQIDLTKTLVILTADHGEYIRSIKLDGEIINLESSFSEKLLWKLGNKIPSSLYGPKRKLSSILHKNRDNVRRKKIEKIKLSKYEERVLTMSRMSLGTHVYDDVLKVPLVFSGYGIKSEEIISQQVGLVDIFPTMTNLIHLSNFKSDTDGINLIPLILGESIDEKPIYIQSMPQISENHSIIIGIRTSKFKYTRDKENKGNVQLFDLINDPLEENDISSSNSEIVTKMENILENILENADSQQTMSNSSFNELERKKVEDELKKLGYI